MNTEMAQYMTVGFMDIIVWSKQINWKFKSNF